LAVLGWFITAAAAAGDDGMFPYRAYVIAVEGYVRSGPGEGFYLTEKLPPGTEVEVYRHDPGGWCAVRPLPESFSWVAGWQVRLAEDGIGEVTGDRVPSRVGSQFSDIREVVQVRLKRGETVQVLGSKEFATGASASTWHRIAPPAGEFRWIEKKQIDTQRPRRTAELASADAAPAIAPPQQVAPPPASDLPKPADPAKPAELPKSAAPVAGQLTAEQFQAELDDINAAMAVLLTQEPRAWNCEPLARRAESLLFQAQTAIERGNARELLNRVSKAIDVKQRQEAAVALANRPPSDNRLSADHVRIGEGARSAGGAEDQFDGVGKLTRVMPSGIGAPRYALVDDRGNVRSYVTPAPGVNVQHYVGRRVGINGIRGATDDQKSPVVTAKHVTPLEGRFVR
jgi:hypothetical protein